MQIIVDNLLINYQLQGSGKLVIFLHGWGDASVGSLKLQSELAKQYQVLAPDLPGFGNSATPPEAWDLDDYSLFLKQLLDKLALTQVYALIGHSNGGAIAIRALGRNVLQPEKLVLIAPAGIRSGNGPRKVALNIMAKAGSGVTIMLPKRYRRQLRQRLYKVVGSDFLVVEHMQETFKKTVTQDVQLDAAKISQPTQIICGDTDKAVTPAMGRRYNEIIQGSQLHMITAGHFVHLDEPELTSELIKEFLSS